MATGGEKKVGYSLAKVGTLTLEKKTDESPWYISIVVCQDKIVVLDFKTRKVQIHRLHDGKFLATSDRLKSGPRDMCLMDAMTICVLHFDGLIKMMAINYTDMSRDIKTTRTLRLEGVMDEYHSVVRLNDSLVVSGVRQDTTYWCVMSLQDGHVDTIHQICKGDEWNSTGRVTTKDNIIYVTSNAGYESPNNGVYGFDILNPSQCKYTYKHQRLQTPSSIVINEDGKIFVCNNGYPNDHDCIHQLTASCQLVAIFTQGIPWDLYAIFWDNGRLYATCMWSSDITVLRHEYQVGSHKDAEEQRNVDKGHSNVKTEMPQSGSSHDDSESGPTPEDSESGPTPEDSESGPELEDSKSGPAPEDSESEPGLEDSESGPAPEDSESGPAPEDSESGLAPEDSESGPAPDDSESGLAPEDSKSGPAPEDFDSGPTPKDSESGSALEDPESGPAPEDFETGPASEDSESGPAPEESESGPAPEDFESGPAPEDSESGPASVDSESGPAPEDSESGPAHEDSESGPAPEDFESGPAPEDFESGPAPEDSESGPAPEDSESGPAPEESESGPAPEDSESRPAPEDSESGPAPEDSESGPAPEESEYETAPEDSEDEKQDHKASEVLMSDEGNTAFEETSTQIVQEIPIQQRVEEKLNQAGIQMSTEERDLFLRFQLQIGTAIYFSNDPHRLIDGQESLNATETFFEQIRPDMKDKWLEYKHHGKLTPELIDVIFTKERNPELHDKKDETLGKMEQLNIIVKARSFDENGVKEDNFFYTPCILRMESPREVISPDQDPRMLSTSVLCWVFTGTFLPPSIFDELLAACLARWPVTKKKDTSENLISYICTVFDLDLTHRLTLNCENHIVYARITWLVIDDIKTPDAKICTKVRKFITRKLSEITDSLNQDVQYELCLRSQESQDVSENTMVRFSPFQVWFQDEGHDPDSPIKPEHMNHARLCVALVTVCGKALREMLLANFPVPYIDTYQAILGNEDKLRDKRGRLLNKDQIKLVFPDPPGQIPGKVETFDLSLLYTLIRNVSTVQAPITGWGNDPQPGDTSLGASVERIRSYRNHISGHSPDAKISHQDFEDYWRKFEAVLRDIEAVIKSKEYSTELARQKRQVISVFDAY